MDPANYQYGFVAKKERRGKRAELPEEIAKKLKSCSVAGCEDWRDLGSPTTYHCFPTGEKNQQRWEIWTSLLQKARNDESWIPFRGSLVCSHHFRSIDFVQDPNQKRRKLVKNAIPSIFPNFTVDLDDPTYAVEDGDDGENSSELILDESGNGENHYYEDSYEQEMEEEDSSHGLAIPEVQVHCDDEESDAAGDYEASQRYSDDYRTSLVGSTITSAQAHRVSTAFRPLPRLTPATSLRKSEQTVYLDEPIPKKRSTSLENNGHLSKMPTQQRPNLTFQGKLGSFHKSSNSTHTPSKVVQPSMNSKLYSQLCQSMKNGTKFPLPWNSDLEIELVEPTAEENLSSLRQKVEDLESENLALKQRFGAQIKALQRKVKEQEKVICEYALALQKATRAVPRKRQD